MRRCGRTALRLSSEITICDASDLVPSRAGNRQVQHNCLIVKVISDKNRFIRIAPHLFAQKIKRFRLTLKIVTRWPNSREGAGISKEQLVDQDKIEIVPKAIEIVLNELVNPDGDDCNYQAFAVQFVQGLKTISCKSSGLRTIFELAACQSATLEMIASLLTPLPVGSDSGLQWRFPLAYAFSVLEESNASTMKEALCGAASFSPNHHRAPTRLR